MTINEAVDNSVIDVEPQERKGVFIPGAIWPDPKKTGFTPERRDPYTRMDRDASYRRKHDKDLQDDNG